MDSSSNFSSTSETEDDNEEEKIYISHILNKDIKYQKQKYPENQKRAQEPPPPKLLCLYNIQNYLQTQLLTVQKEIQILEKHTNTQQYAQADSPTPKTPKERSSENKNTKNKNKNMNPTPKRLYNSPLPLHLHLHPQHPLQCHHIKQQNIQRHTPKSTPLHLLNPNSQIQALAQQTNNPPNTTLQPHPPKTLQELRAITDLLRNLPKPTHHSPPMHIALYSIFHGKYQLPANFPDLDPELCVLIANQFSQKLMQNLATNINRFLKRTAKKHPEKYPPQLFNLCHVICQMNKNKKPKPTTKTKQHSHTI